MAVLSHIVSELWGPKIFANKIVTLYRKIVSTNLDEFFCDDCLYSGLSEAEVAKIFNGPILRY
jgi:hypothetical protein